jgi:hypothetical protein
VSSTSRRGEKLNPPQGGWPPRPLGNQSDIAAIVDWLIPGDFNPALRIAIRSPTDAADFVRKIAVELLADLRSAAHSPKLRDAQEKLLDIQKAARDLDRMLASVSGPHGLTRIVALECGFFRQAATPAGVDYELVDWDNILARPLRALTEKARQYEKELRESAKLGAGRQRLHERLFGDPRLSLAHGCALLLRECRAGEEGPVPPTRLILELMQKIWAYATGEQAPEDLLEHAAEEGAKAARQGNARHRGRGTMRGLIRPKIDD